MRKIIQFVVTCEVGADNARDLREAEKEMRHHLLESNGWAAMGGGYGEHRGRVKRVERKGRK